MKLKKTKESTPDFFSILGPPVNNGPDPSFGERGCLLYDPTADSNNLILHSHDVEKIYNCVKTNTGVSLDWMEGKQNNPEHFTFPELETMRIPVHDLISVPVLFKIDLQEHQIYRSQAGRGSYLTAAGSLSGYAGIPRSEK